MSLISYDLEGRKRDKVQIAIDRLRAFEPEDGYLEKTQAIQSKLDGQMDIEDLFEVDDE